LLQNQYPSAAELWAAVRAAASAGVSKTTKNLTGKEIALRFVVGATPETNSAEQGRRPDAEPPLELSNQIRQLLDESRKTNALLEEIRDLLGRKNK